MFDELRPPEALLYLILGKWYGQAITAAAQLGIADLLANGPHTSDEVARASGANPEATYRIMRCLGAVGVFYETAGKKFELTPIGAALRKDAPGSLAGLAAYEGAKVNLDACAELTHSALTGHSAFTKAHGMPIFEWMPDHPEEVAIYNSAMASLSTTTARAVAAAYDFSTAKSIVDIGGGHGTLLAEILTAAPRARGVLFDAPHVAAAARTHLDARGLQTRCEAIGGDFFKAVPAGHDTYVIKNVLHDWPDDEAVALLTQIARAMTPGGKLLIIEQIVTPPGSKKLNLAKIIDMIMLCLTEGGRERTEVEYREILQRAGFRFERVVATGSQVDVLEAYRQ
jgi:SAM-dependent methyltransferase